MYLKDHAWMAHAQPAPTDWTIVGLADVDGNGNLDLLGQHPDHGEVWTWYMDGPGRWVTRVSARRHRGDRRRRRR